MMGENTKKSVLLECLEYERGLKKMCSVDHQGRMPLKGLEDHFYDQAEKCGILQEMIHALDSETVRRAMADWQKDVMANGPTALKLDGGETGMRM